MQDAQAEVRKLVECRAQLMTAIEATKNEESLRDLSSIAKSSAEGMFLSACKLRNFHLDENQRRHLASVAATREYELYGNRDISMALQAAPPEIRPKISQVLRQHMKKFIDADNIFSEILVRGFPDVGQQQVALMFDGVFCASILSIHHGNDAEAPPHSIAFIVCAEHPDDPDQLNSMDLFEHLIPWNGNLPDKEQLKKWISYDSKKRIVTFAYPDGQVSYRLPPKRSQGVRGKDDHHR